VILVAIQRARAGSPGVGDRLAEGGALLRVAERGLERGLRQADADRRHAEPRDVEDRRSLRLSPADLTAERLGDGTRQRAK